LWITEKNATGSLPLVLSAEMHQGFKQEVEQLPGNAWHLWQKENGEVIWKCTEIPCVPVLRNDKKGSRPYRYVAISVKQQ